MTFPFFLSSKESENIAYNKMNLILLPYLPQFRFITIWISGIKLFAFCLNNFGCFVCATAQDKYK